MADGGRILLRRPDPGGVDPPAEPPVSPARLLRRSVARAGTRLGAALSAIGVADAETTLDEVLAALDDRQLVLALEREGEAVGLAVLDLDLRDVLVEVQTLGQVLPTSAGTGPRRPVTRADAALAQPLIDAILGELCQGGPGTDLPLWAERAVAGPRLATRRDIGACLRAGSYRQVRLSLDPGAPDRQCGLTLLLPRAGAPEPDEDRGDGGRWSAALTRSVMEAPAALHAVLARVRLTLDEVEGFETGQVLPLPGVTVGSVLVESADRAPLGTARLGQVAGLRAVRLELPGVPELGQAVGRRSAAPSEAVLVDAGAGSLPGETAPMAFGIDAPEPALADLPDGDHLAADVPDARGEALDGTGARDLDPGVSRGADEEPASADVALADIDLGALGDLPLDHEGEDSGPTF